MELAFTELAVKILFDDFSGFDEKRWTIILPEKQINHMTSRMGVK